MNFNCIHSQSNVLNGKQMKTLVLIMLFYGINFNLYAQYDMSYLTFTKYLKEEMTEAEFRSIDEHFEGNISGIVCFHEYGEFSGDTLDEFVVLTSENTFEYGQKINVYVFSGNVNGPFNFIDKVSFPYWRSRYEVSVLIRRGVLYVTSTDVDYNDWKWNVFRIKEEGLELVNTEIYQ